MQYFPVFLTAKDIDAIIIGGGEVAARKIDLLLKTPAKITLMSACVNDSVAVLIKKNNITWLAHDYCKGHLANKTMVIAATDDAQVNRQVAAEANEHKILVNVVDEPDLCGYITPSIIDRDPMLIAMSSSGSSPILLRMLREKIEKMLPDRYGALADFSGRFRDKVKQGVTTLVGRRKFWEKALTGNIGQAVLDDNEPLATKLLTQSLQNQNSLDSGDITFIFVGDGDPENLTLKAHRSMQFAEAVYSEHALNPRFIEYIRRDATKHELVNNRDFAQPIHRAKQGEKIICLLLGHRQTIELDDDVNYQVIGSGS